MNGGDLHRFHGLNCCYFLWIAQICSGNFIMFWLEKCWFVSSPGILSHARDHSVGRSVECSFFTLSFTPFSHSFTYMMCSFVSHSSFLIHTSCMGSVLSAHSSPRDPPSTSCHHSVAGLCPGTPVTFPGASPLKWPKDRATGWLRQSFASLRTLSVQPSF